MQIHRNLARCLTIILGLTFSSGVLAQGVHLQFGFSAGVDCDQPLQFRNLIITGDGTGVLNTDRSASADLNIKEFIFTNRLHFDARLGSAAQPAPGGSAQVRVGGRNRLLLIWNLPNNQLTADIAVNGHSCTMKVDTRLKPGMKQYSLYDGSRFYFCGRPRVEQTSCSVN